MLCTPLLLDTQARDQVVYGELALDGDGRILALRAKAYQALGAYWWAAITAPLFFSLLRRVGLLPATDPTDTVGATLATAYSVLVQDALTKLRGLRPSVPGLIDAADVAAAAVGALRVEVVGAAEVVFRAGAEPDGQARVHVQDRRERLAEHEPVAGLCIGIALELFRMHEAHHHQPVNRLD